MKSKTCGECVFFSNSENKCCLLEGPGIRYANNAACKKFKPEPPKPKQTNGDRIRQGGDDALIDFADGIRRRMCHYCTFAKAKSCVDKTGDCWEGVRAYLNAPADCVKKNGNHDTQADLCKVDNTESEGKMSKKCSLCGEVLPDYCISDVEISYKVNGQTVLNRKRKICARCQSITVQEITSSDFFPDKWDRQCHLIPYDGKLGKHCPDCAVQKGEFHQNGCDHEKCPICGLQLLSCGHGDQVPLPPEERGRG